MKSSKADLFLKIGLIALLGLAAGILYDLLHMTHYTPHFFNGWENNSFLNVFLSAYTGWAVIECIIAYKSKTPWHAALFCFIFTLFSQPTTRIFEWMLNGFEHLPPTLPWVFISFFTLPLGWLMWHARQKSLLGMVAKVAPAVIFFVFGVLTISRFNAAYMAHIIPEGKTIVNNIDMPATLYVQINRIVAGLILVGFAYLWAFKTSEKEPSI
ncbi:hypothetical protein FACS1894217_04470 [Clostridia bacterium]|nr:hypothetical protein FACS1894217_04470 [Clostridia bacterium]